MTDRFGPGAGVRLDAAGRPRVPGSVHGPAARIGRRSFLAGLVAAALPAGCAAPRRWPDPPAEPPSAPRAETLHLVAPGWHTEIGLEVSAIADTPLGRFLAPRFPGARHLLFGFGLRSYFTHPDPGSADLLAALAPGPATVRASALRTAPVEVFAPEAVVALPVTAAGLGRVARFLWEELEKDDRGLPRAIAEDSARRGVFYAAVTDYDLGYTCNTWTVVALRLAGLPVDPTGVVFAGQAMDRARAAAMAVVRGGVRGGAA